MSPTVTTARTDDECVTPVTIPRTWLVLTAVLIAAEVWLAIWLCRAPMQPAAVRPASPLVDLTSTLLLSYPKGPHIGMLIFLGASIESICAAMAASSKPEHLERIGPVLSAAVVLACAICAVFYMTL